MSLLSVQNTLKIIDKYGDHDGVATLADIKPHLDSEGNATTTGDLQDAFVTLNRICGNSSQVFKIPTLLSCNVIKDEKLDPALLQNTEDRFILKQFDRLFNNVNADLLLKQRYQEFLDFIKTNHIPLSELYNVMENRLSYQNKPPEIWSLDDDMKLGSQMVVLFQVSLYAAIWHLKNNIKAFSPAELVKYPVWFRSKVTGFEDTALQFIKEWAVIPSLGIKTDNMIVFNRIRNTIRTPTTNPFPPILGAFLPIAIHELFHAYRLRKAKDEPIWVAERDAALVEGISFVKGENINDINDKKIEAHAHDLEELGINRTTADKKQNAQKKIIFEMELRKNQYALIFSKTQKSEKSTLIQQSFEDSKTWEVVSELEPLARQFFEETCKESTSCQSPREAMLYFINYLKQNIPLAESALYRWPNAKSKKIINFKEMVKRLNILCEKIPLGSENQFLDAYQPYLLEVTRYIVAVNALEMTEISLKQYDEESANSLLVDTFSLTKTHDFLKKYPYVLWFGMNAEKK